MTFRTCSQVRLRRDAEAGLQKLPNFCPSAFAQGRPCTGARIENRASSILERSGNRNAAEIPACPGPLGGSIENRLGGATSSKKGCRSGRQPKQTSIHGKLCTAKNGFVPLAMILQTGSATKPPLWEKLRNSSCSFRHTFQFRHINITQTKMSSKKSGKGRFSAEFSRDFATD